MKLSGILLCAMASTSLAKPLLQGQYEVVSVVTPDGKTAQIADMMLGKHGVFVRLFVIYDGDKLTTGTQRLELEDGVYRACEVSVFEKINWTAKGYSIPVEAGARGRVTFFKSLTPKNQSADDRECSFSLNPETLEVVPGDTPKLRASDGTVIVLRAIGEDLEHTDWAKHLPKKK